MRDLSPSSESVISGAELFQYTMLRDTNGLVVRSKSTGDLRKRIPMRFLIIGPLARAERAGNRQGGIMTPYDFVIFLGALGIIALVLFTLRRAIGWCAGWIQRRLRTAARETEEAYHDGATAPPPPTRRPHD